MNIVLQSMEASQAKQYCIQTLLKRMNTQNDVGIFINNTSTAF